MGPIKGFGYYLTGPNSPLERRDFTIDSVGPGDAVVKVAGCGLCHTDLGFFTGNVKTKRELPLILGHEISGEVVSAGANFQNLVGKNVIIPAVLPCGECSLCKSGRDNICQKQLMPGNDLNGGFASHLVVPGRALCTLPGDLGRFKVSELSVIADAVTTPLQSLKRSKLAKGELAIVIGVGGIGIYMVELARDAGARVIAIDVDDKKLAAAQKGGAEFTINSKDLPEDDVKKQVRTLVKENELPREKWRVFETSGTAAGQTTAFSLLSFAGTLGIVGFTMNKVTVRLSNVMAFDADIFGNWGCSPSNYPEAVEKVLGGRINLLDYIEVRELAVINEVIPLALEHKLEKRVIFTP